MKAAGSGSKKKNREGLSNLVLRIIATITLVLTQETQPTTINNNEDSRVEEQVLLSV
jgi:hypothetical protein